MKIIRTSNYDKSGECPGEDEYVVAEKVDDRYGQFLIQQLNSQCPDRDFYILVPDDYVLKVFEP